jgi:hypothetical protein
MDNADSLPQKELFCPHHGADIFSLERFFNIAPLVAVDNPDFPDMHRIYQELDHDQIT